MAYTLTVNGVTRAIQTGSIRFFDVANGPGSLIVDIKGVTPTVRQTVILNENGTDIFGGTIEKVTITGPGGLPVAPTAAPYVARIEAKSFKAIADELRVTHTFAAGSTLEDAIDWLDTNVFSTRSISKYAAQVTGFTLPEDMEYDGATASSVLNDLALVGFEVTGKSWIWFIDASDEFGMFEGGTNAAPSNMTSGTDNVGDVTVEYSSEKYANQVTVKFGPTGNMAWTDNFTGNGSTDTFSLTYPIALGSVHPYSWAGYVTNGATNETLDVAGFGAEWEYDPVAQTIERVTGAPANLNAISINYDVTFPQTVVATDASYATTPVDLHPVPYYPNITNKGHAQAIADALLAQHLTTTVEVSWRTRALGLMPGQSLTVTATERGISASTFLIAEVRATTLGSKPELIRTVKAIQGNVFRGTYIDGYRAWLASGGGATASTTAAPTVAAGFGSTTSPGSPTRSIQFNNAGAFGGDSKFLYKGTATYSGFPAQVRIENEDESRYQLALVADDGTFWVFQVFNGGDMYANGGRDWNLQPSQDFAVSAGREFIVDIGNNFSDAIHLRGLVGLFGLGSGIQRTTSTTFTIDTTNGAGLHTLICDAGGGAITVNLPALASANVTLASGVMRMLCIRNDGSSNNVTIDPNSSETIDGASTYALTPGQSVWIQALTGTGAGWKILAKHG